MFIKEEDCPLHAWPPIEMSGDTGTALILQLIKAPMLGCHSKSPLLDAHTITWQKDLASAHREGVRCQNIISRT